jgi:hypothetical protein
MAPGRWIEQIVKSVGKNFALETTDGVTRQGKVTGLTHKSFMLNGVLVDMPVEIEVNGDPNDRIPLDRLLTLKIY